jgi:hypothetical protein
VALRSTALAVLSVAYLGVGAQRDAVAGESLERWATSESLELGVYVSPVAEAAVRAPFARDLRPPIQLRAAAGYPQLYEGGTGKKLTSVEFWMELAWCETHQDWTNGGEYGGGLGIYTGTWRAWGGEEFAPVPQEATVAEQIVVANRISTQGWVRPDGTLQDPVWFSGWGALGCAGDPERIPLDDRRGYMPEHGALLKTTPVPLQAGRFDTRR